MPPVDEHRVDVHAGGKRLDDEMLAIEEHLPIAGAARRKAPESCDNRMLTACDALGLRHRDANSMLASGNR